MTSTKLTQKQNQQKSRMFKVLLVGLSHEIGKGRQLSQLKGFWPTR